MHRRVPAAGGRPTGGRAAGRVDRVGDRHRGPAAGRGGRRAGGDQRRGRAARPRRPRRRRPARGHAGARPRGGARAGLHRGGGRARRALVHGDRSPRGGHAHAPRRRRHGDRAVSAPRPGSTLAHALGGDDWSATTIAVLGLAALGYTCLLAWSAPRRRSPWAVAAPGAAWLAGLAALGAALASPLERLAEDSLTAHMVQHLLLTIVAAPLLVVADPVPRVLSALPPRARDVVARPWAAVVRGARRPGVVLVVAVGYLAVVLLWHLPGAYEAAVRSEALHVAEHLTFLAAAAVFWWCVLRIPRRRLGQLVAGLVAVLVPAFGEAVLGGAMMLSSTPWYEVYVGTAADHGFDPVADQQVAGAVLWATGTPVYLLAAVVLVLRLVRSAPAEDGPPVPVPPMPGRARPALDAAGR
ncbi:cytochrome c oxidase assembly protein [Blastococcus sp. MG754426]|nr:cytochrome c oxidase assembly protein [Blastococcus sp. MG754426]MCF6510563.1 cytochrome c oxidase assembly protein [Blastococcus sp. MG754427]